jgi:hypothetical protein
MRGGQEINHEKDGQNDRTLDQKLSGMERFHSSELVVLIGDYKNLAVGAATIHEGICKSRLLEPVLSACQLAVLRPT